MVLAPEVKLVIKHTFFELVEDRSAGGLRPRSFTDSAVNFSTDVADKASVLSECKSAGASAVGEQNLRDATIVNESATEDLKAFLGLNSPLYADEVPCSPPQFPSSPSRPVGSPFRRSPALPPLQEEDQLLDVPVPPAVGSLPPFELPQCTMSMWWVPVGFNVAPLACSTAPFSFNESDALAGWENKSPDPSLLHSQAPARETVEQRTTVIVRNLPNNYTRDMLVDLIDSEGFPQQYDFVYLPIDFASQAGLGYAFVNLVSPAIARQFWEHFEGYRKWTVPSEKVCALNWASPVQGLHAHVERYKNSPVMHEAVPDHWKPVIFSHGQRVAFPPPTKPIRAPKIRNRPQGGY